MPVNLFLFFILYLNVLFPVDNEHKFYVSTTSIEFKSKSKSLQIISQLFTDDLQLIISEQDESIILDPDSDLEFIDQLIENYFKKNLVFSSEGVNIPYVFLGKEYLNDITKCFIELNFSEVPKNVELSNELFLSLFKEQQNIVHFKNLDQRKSYLLHKNKRSVLLKLAP